MPEGKFELYVPVHLRRLHLDIKRLKEGRKLKPAGFAKKLKNIFEK